MELEDAIQNLATQTIFIPKNASIATQHLNSIVERNPIKKTIFWENDTVITSYSIHYTKLYDSLRFPKQRES